MIVIPLPLISSVLIITLWSSIRGSVIAIGHWWSSSIEIWRWWRSPAHLSCHPWRKNLASSLWGRRDRWSSVLCLVWGKIGIKMLSERIGIVDGLFTRTAVLVTVIV